MFNEDFGQLIVSGDDGWAEVDEYVTYVAPHLADRLSRWDSPDGRDVFAEYRIDEQLAKAMERKVWLPSGGSLVIDRTEAMTVVDVNTGKFTGQGGNLEETVTRNNLEAAEEIVRQLRLRDVGGIIVIDFIDMVLESNRELVLRRLLECLARDRTKHQVAEVTSLGLVQMTRKRVGAGLLEAFSEPCECCNGRGVHVSLDLADIGSSGSDSSGNSGQSNGHGRGRRGSESKSDDTRSGGNGSERRCFEWRCFERRRQRQRLERQRQRRRQRRGQQARRGPPQPQPPPWQPPGRGAQPRRPERHLGPGGRLGQWRRGHRRPGNDGCPRDRGHRRPDPSRPTPTSPQRPRPPRSRHGRRRPCGLGPQPGPVDPGVLCIPGRPDARLGLEARSGPINPRGLFSPGGHDGRGRTGPGGHRGPGPRRRPGHPRRRTTDRRALRSATVTA